MRIIKPIAGLCLAALLSACGGDGAGSATTPAVLTGVFVDSPVSGLSYTTATKSGTTNANGEFWYTAGESVTFSIGRIQLPTVVAKAIITPLDIAKTTDVNNQVATNILVLLQSLDADGNPDNGITISATASAQAVANVNFDVSPAVFAANADVIRLVANSGSVTKTLIPAAQAVAHFQQGATPTPTPTPTTVTATCAASNFTVAKLNAIAVGMTLDQVDQLIGCAHGAPARSTTLVLYQWQYMDVNNAYHFYNIGVAFDPTGAFVLNFYQNGVAYKTSAGF